MKNKIITAVSLSTLMFITGCSSTNQNVVEPKKVEKKYNYLMVDIYNNDTLKIKNDSFKYYLNLPRNNKCTIIKGSSMQIKESVSSIIFRTTTKEDKKEDVKELKFEKEFEGSEINIEYCGIEEDKKILKDKLNIKTNISLHNKYNNKEIKLYEQKVDFILDKDKEVQKDNIVYKWIYK